MVLPHFTQTLFAWIIAGVLALVIYVTERYADSDEHNPKTPLLFRVIALPFAIAGWARYRMELAERNRKAKRK